MKKEAKDLLPGDVDTGSEFMGSSFENGEVEAVACNIVIIQRKINPLAWTPFDFEDYQRGCTHRVVEQEEIILKALAKGGEPFFRAPVTLEPGYLIIGEDGKYRVTEKFLKVIAKFIKR